MKSGFLSVMTAPAPIHFRVDPLVSSGQVISTLLITVLLLGVTWVLVRFAHRKGWLARWQAPVPSGGAVPDLTVLASRRISRQTNVFLVETGGVRYMLVESSLKTELLALGNGDADGMAGST
ncbi:MAG TPA: hypothetical protein VGC19_10865 [Rhodanobacter sp.]